MKKILYFGLSIVVIIMVIVWRQHVIENKINLLIHQPIAINQVAHIETWKKGTNQKSVPTDEYIKIVKWFNQYEYNNISEKEVSKIPNAQAEVVINTDEGQTIIINYAYGKIYVGRDDISPGISYIFLGDAPKLENFFKELIH